MLIVSAAISSATSELVSPRCRSSATCPRWPSRISSSGRSGSSSCSAPAASFRTPSGPTMKAIWRWMPLKESLSLLESLKSRTMIVHGVCDRVRRRRRCPHARDGCLLTGIELFPGNVRGARHPGRSRARGISIDQEIKNRNQPNDATRTCSARFLEFGVLVPNRADTWTRMVYAGRPIGPIAPIDDPYRCSTSCMAGRATTRRLGSVLDDLRGDLGLGSPRPSLPRIAGCSRNTLTLHPRDGAGTLRPAAASADACDAAGAWEPASGPRLL